MVKGWAFDNIFVRGFGGHLSMNIAIWIHLMATKNYTLESKSTSNTIIISDLIHPSKILPQPKNIMEIKPILSQLNISSLWFKDGEAPNQNVKINYLRYYRERTDIDWSKTNSWTKWIGIRETQSRDM